MESVKEHNLRYYAGIFYAVVPTNKRTPILRRPIYMVVRYEAGVLMTVMKGSYKKCKKYVDDFNKFFEEEKEK